MESDQSPDAGPPLAQVARARNELAERLVTPWWYHPVLGVLVAQHALVQGFDNRNWTLPSAILLLGGCVGLVVAYRRLTGLSITGPTGPRSRALLLIQVLLVMALTWVPPLIGGLPWSIAAALVLFVATVVLGRMYDEALRRDLRLA